MTQSTGPIVPTTHAEISETAAITGLSNVKRPGPQPNIIVHQHFHQQTAPKRPLNGPSHYVPVPIQPTDNGLRECARWGLGALVALLCTWLLGAAIVHFSNVSSLTYERQWDRQNGNGYRLSNY